MKLWLRVVIIGSLFWLAACSNVPVKSGADYKLAERASLYTLEYWSFEGRLALSDSEESWTASIEWQHSKLQDAIKLSGPLGQGAVVISLMADGSVNIDTGDEEIQRSENIDEFIQQQLGFFVPVQALRYWVLGLTSPNENFDLTEHGFSQSQWDISFAQMQKIANIDQWMPRKLTAKQQHTKLKIIIDDWIL